MKTLYESLLTGKVTKPSAKVQPSSRDELKQIIDGYIEEIKPRPGQEVNLNWIDISKVDKLDHVFANTTYIPVIDTWKIDHVKTFEGSFANNRYIKKSPWPKLQTKLRPFCYVYMFADCTALEVAPELPATDLKKGCYDYMFHGCTSLKKQAKIPSNVKLKYSVSEGMYSLCPCDDE